MMAYFLDFNNPPHSYYETYNGTCNNNERFDDTETARLSNLIDFKGCHRSIVSGREVLWYITADRINSLSVIGRGKGFLWGADMLIVIMIRCSIYEDKRALITAGHTNNIPH